MLQSVAARQHGGTLTRATGTAPDNWRFKPVSLRC